MTTQQKIEQLRTNNERLYMCGGAKAVDKQHAKHKYTARERIRLLLDEGSFHEIGLYVKHQCTDFGMAEKEIPADGVVTGYGSIDGRKVFVYSQDFTASGGSMGKMQAMKICRILDMAAEAGAPVIGINDSGGARIQEGVDSLAGYGEIFRRTSLYSGKIPQFTLIMGPCAGGAAYAPALNDIVFMMEKTGQMFCTGPAIIKEVTKEEIDAESLGGAMTHATLSGEVHVTAGTEEELFADVRKVLSYFPDDSKEKPPAASCEKGSEERELLNAIMPDNRKHPYDMLDVIAQVADPDSFFELQPLFADNLITGFARIAGKSVGIIANQPYVMGGALDMNAADKGARFINLCSAYKIPMISLMDVPGFLPGIDQEHQGILRHGAKMLYAFSVAEVPKITVILRKAYGGAYMAMCSKEMGADFVYAWPTAEIAVMGAEGAVNIVFRKEIADAEDPGSAREALVKEYMDTFATPYAAASRGYIDAIIAPSDTRKEIIASLALLENKQNSREHTNMPL